MLDLVANTWAHWLEKPELFLHYIGRSILDPDFIGRWLEQRANIDHDVISTQSIFNYSKNDVKPN